VVSKLVVVNIVAVVDVLLMNVVVTVGVVVVVVWTCTTKVTVQV
jgi:hypothetical protein